MLLTPSGRKSFDHPTDRHNDIGIAGELSIHDCIQLGLKMELIGNHVGSQIPEPDSDSFDWIGGIPKVRFN